MDQDLIYVSGEMEGIYKMVQKIAVTNATVLITGESGTGKEKLAQLIHSNSPRSNRPFVTINCAALPETLLEAELFGVTKGAYTSADKDRIGLIESANLGTLFIDEIGDLPYSAQVKLLRFLQDHTFTPIGSIKLKQVDVRVISATNKDPEKLVKEGTFREDLLYRLNVVRIHIPPLRHRRSDIRPLIEYYLEIFATQYNKKIKGVDPLVWKKLLSYEWFGNVRELKNKVERAVILANQDVLQLSDFQFDGQWVIDVESTRGNRKIQENQNEDDSKYSENAFSQSSQSSFVQSKKEISVSNNLQFYSFIQNLLQKNFSYLAESDIQQIQHFRREFENNFNDDFSLSHHFSKYHIMTLLYEMELIFRALIQSNGNKSKAAAILGISEKNIRDRIKKWQSEFQCEVSEECR
ncbi:MAG: sigma-54 dependent transcriptional regulator [bacterium]|nr:sigma-54 dependent transcriptional regulator [bacterium]